MRIKITVNECGNGNFGRVTITDTETGKPILGISSARIYLDACNIPSLCLTTNDFDADINFNEDDIIMVDGKFKYSSPPSG